MRFYRLHSVSPTFPKPLIVAVDLQLVGPRGESGGIKPTIFAQLKGLSECFAGALEFILLVNREIRDEVSSVFPQAKIVVVCDYARPLNVLPNSRLLFWAKWIIRRAHILYAPVWFSPYHTRRRPTIVCVVDTLHRDFPGMLSGREELVWREKVIRYGLSTAAFVQTISNVIAEKISYYYQIESSRIVVTYLPPAKIGVRTNEICELDKTGFLYPANLWPHKNHERLLHAYSIYRTLAGTSAWTLFCTGGHEKSRLRALKEIMGDLNLPRDSVQFLGFLEAGAYAELWMNTGALIFPSLYEGFGMPLLEAMNFGVPIAASQTAAIPEVVRNAGILFDPTCVEDIAASMFRLSSDSALRAELIIKGRARLAEFSPLRESSKLADAFSKAVVSHSKNS